MRKTLVVVGHGMVGHRLVELAVERGLTAEWDVVVPAFRCPQCASVRSLTASCR